MNRIIDILISCGAANAAFLKYEDCEIINRRIADKLEFVPHSIIIATLPYYTKYCDAPRTVSAYALAYDYHIHMKNIASEAINKAKQLFPEASFAYFGDHSPINERDAAAKAGLGIIGKHGLLITPNHSSYVFLFEIITDIICDVESQNISHCISCNKCLKACPGYLSSQCDCLSNVTQKKKDLLQEEIDMIFQRGSAWGCDICQEVCPYTIEAKEKGTLYTDSEWFNNNICTTPTLSTVANDTDFSMRAYSWRGKDTILRNIKILNGNNHD